MAATVAESNVLVRIAEADTLPTPPVVLTQINKVMSDPNTSAQDVAAVVSEDPAITAKILRMVNSAFYAISDTVTSVRQAIFILGIDAVQSLVQCAGVFEAFSRSDQGAAFQDRFWRHSLQTASAARVICTPQKGGKRPAASVLAGAEEAFTAGLLHDIGKMVLACYLPDERALVWEHPSYGKVPDAEVESEVLGIDHTAIGAALAERWQLPLPLRSAIEHHHDLEVGDASGIVLARIAHVANYLAHIVEKEPHREVVLPPIVWHQASAFGLNEDSVPDFADRVREEYGRAQVFLQMIDG
jgi:putative nucleotidyltransferase with HDIG domain